MKIIIKGKFSSKRLEDKGREPFLSSPFQWTGLLSLTTTVHTENYSSKLNELTGSISFYQRFQSNRKPSKTIGNVERDSPFR